jgi:hypothetical protein
MEIIFLLKYLIFISIIVFKEVKDMRRLLVLLGIVGSISGYVVNMSDVQEIFSSTEYSYEAKEIAANEVADAFEDIYERILNNDEMF